MILRFETDRLLIRLFEQSDAKVVQVLAGDEKVARTTLSIPHPYPNGAAEKWIESTHQSVEKGDSYFAAAMTKNPGSCKVMKKIGMKYEGTFPQHVWKWGSFEDIELYGMVKSDYDKGLQTK